mgnify:CR=1 FL=1
MGLEAVVLSTQHAPEVQQEDLREAVMEQIIKPVLPARWLGNRKPSTTSTRPAIS